MENLDHNDYLEFSLELAAVNYIRECRANNMSIDDILSHLDTYLDSFTWDNVEDTEPNVLDYAD